MDRLEKWIMQTWTVGGVDSANVEGIEEWIVQMCSVVHPKLFFPDPDPDPT